MIVRPAIIEDSATLARIQVDSYRTAYQRILPQAYLEHFTYEEQTQDWHDLLASEPADILLVAELETGEVMGYALGRPGATKLQPYDCEMVALHVHAPHEGRGAGRKLTIELAQRFLHLGCQALIAWVLAENYPARRFYEWLGGRLCGTQGIEIGDGETKASEVAYGWLDINQLARSPSPPCKDPALPG